MKAQLALEHIGAFKYDTVRRIHSGKVKLTSSRIRDISIGTFYIKPWVADITDERRVLRYNKDASQANSAFTRGVYLWFILESGRLYEVFEMLSWTRTAKYWCTVTENGDIQKLSFEEKEQWLKNR
jgi:hypothetical protein